MKLFNFSQKLLLTLTLLLSFKFAFTMKQNFWPGTQGKGTIGTGSSSNTPVQTDAITGITSNPTGSLTTRYFDQLPPEIITYILNKLDKPEELYEIYNTSKKFRVLLTPRHLIKSKPRGCCGCFSKKEKVPYFTHPIKLDLSELTSMKDDQLMSLVKRFNVNIVSINLGSNYRITDKAIIYIANNCPNLAIFKLCIVPKDNEKISSQALVSLISNCKKLTTLKITHNCQILGFTVNNEVALAIANNSTDLVDLDISNNRVDQDSIIELIKHCKKLENLNISNSYSVNSNANVTKIIDALIENCPRIKNLEFAGLRPLTDIDVIRLAQKYKDQLTSLNLNNCENLTDNSLIELTNNCPKLEKLEIDGCNKFTFEALNILTKQCINLNEIAINQLTPNEKLKIYKNVHQLKTLKDSTIQLDDTNIDEFIQNCPNLVSIYIDSIIETALQKLIQNLNFLTDLTIMSNNNLKNLAIHSNTLKKLILYGYNLNSININSPSIESLFICHTQENLDLSLNSSNLTELHFEVGTTNFQNINLNLPKLNLIKFAASPTSNTSEQNISAILQSCHSLKKAIFSNYSNITENLINNLINNNSDLKSVYFSYCPQISAKFIKKIRRKNPQIKFLSNF